MGLFDDVTIDAVDRKLFATGAFLPGVSPEDLMAHRVMQLRVEVSRRALTARSEHRDTLILELNWKWQALVLDLLRLPKTAHAYAKWTEGLLTNEELERIRSGQASDAYR